MTTVTSAPPPAQPGAVATPGWVDVAGTHAWRLPDSAACRCAAWEHLRIETVVVVTHEPAHCVRGRADADILIRQHPWEEYVDASSVPDVAPSRSLDRAQLAGFLRGDLSAPDPLAEVRAERAAEEARTIPAALAPPADAVAAACSTH
ncbi:hypothetical protein, partial [Tsukamurella soli]|uniref:hypothetical protein n=1 Tax=Tsukamurella soli TaxID=644556 RepID=UPI0031EB0C79